MTALILNIILPVFGIVGVGWLAARTGYVSEAAIDGLTRFVFAVATPLLLARAIARLEIGEVFELRAVVAYFAGAFLAYLVGDRLAARVFARPRDDQAILGFGCMYSNAVLLGIPLMLRAFGDEGAARQAIIIAFHSPVLFSLFAIAIGVKRAEGASLGRVVAKSVLDIARNPIPVGIMTGVAVNLSGVTIPTILDEMVEMIGRAAIPCALFAMGGGLVRYSVVRGVREALMVSAVKLLMFPAVVFALCWAMGVDPLWRAVATLTAAMPPGVNVFILASQYKAAPGAASSAVVIASTLSVATVTLVLALLGVP